jgi:hypothetical protein
MSAKVLLVTVTAVGAFATAAIAGSPLNPGGFGHDAVAQLNHTSDPGTFGGLRSTTGGAKAVDQTEFPLAGIPPSTMV